MATNYLQPGDVLDITNATGSAVVSGEPIAIGFNRAGIALVDIANAAAGSVQVSGVFELAKNTSDAAVVGAPAYWKGSADEVVNAPEVGALFLGFFTEAAIAAAGLPVRMSDVAPVPFDAHALVRHMAQDKKAEAGRLTFILARGLGDTFVAKDVDAAAVEAFLKLEGAS